MAITNKLDQNPVIIDNVSDAHAIDYPVSIDWIYYYNPTTAGHVFALENADGGDVLLKGRCEANAESQVFNMHGQTFAGLHCSAVTSGGTLYIYLR